MNSRELAKLKEKILSLMQPNPADDRLEDNQDKIVWDRGWDAAVDLVSEVLDEEIAEQKKNENKKYELN